MNTELHLTESPPATLTGHAARERWTLTIHDLEAEGRKLPRSNEGVLIGYASAFQLLADCDEGLKTDGLLIDGGRDGKRRHPALAGKLQALAAIRGFGVQLGLSPTSAKGLPVPPVDPEPNPYDSI